MQHDSRVYKEKKEQKRLIFYASTFIGLAIITFVISYFIYNNKNKTETKQEESLFGMIENEDTIDAKQVTSPIGNEINNIIEENVLSSEMKNETNIIEIPEKNEKEIYKENKIKEKQNIKEEEVKIDNKDNKDNNENNLKKENEKTEEKYELHFSKPVEGDIIKTYAKENLVYSETLKEWTTHNGIDIRADRTTVVKASEQGIVKSIKNDPRYGLSIIIEHVTGIKTVYANLLSSEFVVEGETVEKGQSIGTVGNTSSFELLDPPHLHFEMLIDENNVDPLLYIEQ